MAIGSVYDVHVAPDERPGGRGEARLGIGAPFVLVRVRVAVVFAGARADRERRKGEREQRREVHRGGEGGGGATGDASGCRPGYLYLRCSRGDTRRSDTRVVDKIL